MIWDSIIDQISPDVRATMDRWVDSRPLFSVDDMRAADAEIRSVIAVYMADYPSLTFRLDLVFHLQDGTSVRLRLTEKESWWQLS